MALAKIASGEPIAAKPAPFLNAIDEVLAEPSSNPGRKTFAPMIWPTFEREEIKQRVANFRAHQQKLTHEPEDFYLQTMAKALSPIKHRS
jgi:hypothetical protein